MNLENLIIIAIYFHICGYEGVFTKLYIRIGLYIYKSFSNHLHIFDARIKHGRVYKRNTHVNILIYQMKKIGTITVINKK